MTVAVSGFTRPVNPDTRWAKGGERQDWVVALAVVREGGSLIVASGKRTFTLKPADLDLYQGVGGAARRCRGGSSGWMG